MNFMVRLNLLLVCAGLTVGTRLLAAETSPAIPPPATDSPTQNVANSLLQIQEQIHAAQLTLQNIESNRQAMADKAQANGAAITVRVQALEQSIATDRARQLEMMQKSQRWMLGLIGAFGAVILMVMLLLGYLQWRAVRRLVGLAARPMELPAGSGSMVVEESKARLFSAVDLLEKKILGLEQMAARPLATTTASATNGHPPSVHDERADPISNLLADGQTLLNGNKPEQAIILFNDFLSMEPQH